MISRWFKFDASKIWISLLLICELIGFGQAAGSVLECRTFIIASTLGTFAACFVITVAVFMIIRRCTRNERLRESRRKVAVEESTCTENLHFESTMDTQVISNEPASEVASPVLENIEIVTYGETSNRTTDESFGDIRLICSDASTQTNESFLAKPKHQLVVIEKTQDGGLGLNLAVAGLYVKTVGENCTLKSGCIVEPGDEILSINGRQVEGMTDMEALALLAKAGPTVLLEVVKHAFLWRLGHQRDKSLKQDVSKKSRHRSPKCSISKEAALKKAKTDVDEALSELRRCTAASQREIMRDNANIQQSLTNSVEVPRSMTEEDFVVIDSNEVMQSHNAIVSSSPRVSLETGVNTKEAPKDINLVDKRPGNERDENGNVLHGVADSKSDRDQGVRPVKDKTIGDPLVISHATEIVVTSSNSTCEGVAEGTRSRQGLFLPLKSIVNGKRKASPPEGAQIYSSTAEGAQGSPSQLQMELEDRINNGTNNEGYYIVHNGNISSPMLYTKPPEAHAAATTGYDLDIMRPPPSYEVASQIFNSQLRGGKSSFGESINGTPTGSEIYQNGSLDSQLSYCNSLSNDFSSQHSSYDEVESIMPTLLGKINREKIGIDEHVMRYMTKKYSEPRFPITSSNSASSPSQGLLSGPKFASPATTSTPVNYRNSPVPTNRYKDKAQSPNSLPSIGRAMPSKSFSELNEQPAVVNSASYSQKSSAIISSPRKGDAAHVFHNNNQQSDFTPITTRAVSYNDISKSVAWKRRPETGSEIDLRSNFASNFDPNIPEAGDSPGISFAVKSRKAVSMNRPSRPQKHKFQSEEALKYMRRAASSPSVNAEHQRGGSSESQTEMQSGVKRTGNKRNGRRINDESFDRRKSIDSGSLRKLATELHNNQSLSDDFPMLSRLLGGAGFQNAENTSNLCRYSSSDTLHGKI